MGREYFAAYHSYLQSIEPLSDAERGRLFTACLAYSASGATPDFRGNERFIWPTMREQIDRDRAAYDRKSQTLRNNANARWKMQMDANGCKCTQEKEEGEGERECSPPLTPPPGGDDGKKPEVPRAKMIVPPDLPEEVQDAMTRWRRYKAERGDRYKLVGWSALCTRVRGMVDKHGAAAVVDIINASMASGYSGITWDRIGGAARTQQGAAKSQRPTSYDLTEIERMTRGCKP